MFENEGYFQERLGINCVDGYIDGSVGALAQYSFRNLRRNNLFPIWDRKDDSLENEIFVLTEFLYDHASQPVPSTAQYHSFIVCYNDST